MGLQQRVGPREEPLRTSEFYDKITLGGVSVIEEMIRLFEEEGIRYCLIGGQAVNH
jgi:hypothetical protein